ncbi:MAG: YihY/virulence factor BrkB family protein [Bacteroidales bacterium]|nr:YihY/virulence factor BrkB family protein [Bacteroidales bacterium]MBN2762925.1 YihY/virulence factor BrkB family protein [Bacteroidales bacterium]
MSEIPPHKRTYYFFNKQVHQLGDRLRRMPFPGSKGIPVYDVFIFFFRGLIKGSLNTRASAIAFNFLLALGPGVIFLLTLIPFLPIQNFQKELLEILYDLIPENSYIAIESLVDELFRKHASLQIFGFLVTFFFAQKGLSGMIEAFNATYHTVETRPWLEIQMVSLGLILILLVLISFSGLLLLFSKLGARMLFDAGIIRAYGFVVLMQIGKWVIIFFLTFFAISSLYYFAPARKTKWRFFSPGSFMATMISIVASLIFSYFVNHFAPFNRFYGSIGTLIAMMLWMNFSALALLIGFELNASIKNAQIKTNEPISI